MERLTADEATRRWEFLLQIQNLHPASAETPSSAHQRRKNGRSSSIRNAANRAVDDPFDCRSVAVLPTYDLVEKALQTHLAEWQKLDDRRVRRPACMPVPSAQTVAATHAVERPFKRRREDEPDPEDITGVVVTTAGGPSVPHEAGAGHRGGWRYREDRLQLPEGFDYASALKRPPPDDGVSGDRVISLDDPTLTLSYERELWKLFASVPTSDELGRDARAGHGMLHTLRVHQETHALKRTAADCHSLARLRMSDRHGLPPMVGRLSSGKGTSTTMSARSSSSSYASMKMVATIRLECWKRQPNRSPSPDSNRLVLEFLASQTLWDVHNTLDQMAEDDLWTTTLIAPISAVPSATDVERTIATNASTATVDTEEATTQMDNEKSSGCFFIEDSFYSTGPVDYVQPILDWIDGYGSKPNPSRRGYLGISAHRPLKNDKTMKETKLGQVPFRLGVRYYHVCHGDVETAVILTDRRLSRHDGDSAAPPDKVSYPLIHDVWTPSKAVPLCDACQTYSALFVTSTECEATDGGPRLLCEECCRDLSLFEKEPNSVMLYTAWKQEAELSTGVTRQFTTLF